MNLTRRVNTGLARVAKHGCKTLYRPHPLTSSYSSSYSDTDSEPEPARPVSPKQPDAPTEPPASEAPAQIAEPEAKPASDSAGEEEEEEWEVEKVIGKRIRHKRVQYLLKWKGYPVEESTWEYADDCFCKDLIEDFLQREERKSKHAHTSHTTVRINFVQPPRRPLARERPISLSITKIGQADGRLAYVMKLDDGRTMTMDSARARRNNITELARQLENVLFSRLAC